MQRTTAKLAGALFVLALIAPSIASAQNRVFGNPVFVFQPGLVTTNFLDAGDAESETDFNFRVVTAVPFTAVPRTTLVAIVQFTPFNEDDAGQTHNSPGFVYGPVFSLINTPMFSLDFDVLGAYGPAGKPDDESDYTHKLVLEADAFFKIGSMMAAPESRFRSLALYAMLAHVTTGIPDDASPWVLLTGLSLPIAP